MKLAIDIGSGLTKISAENGVRCHFPSIVGHTEQLDDISKSLGVSPIHAFKYNDEMYLTGNTAASKLLKEEFCPTATDEFSSSLPHKILLYSAIVAYCLHSKNPVFGKKGESSYENMIQARTITVDLAVGLPIAKFSASRDDYQNSLVGKHDIEFLDGNTLTLDVQSAIVLPQAAAAIYSLQMADKSSDFKKRHVGLIDVGTHSVGLATFFNGEFTPSQSDGFSNAGMYHMARKTCKSLSSYTTKQLSIDKLLDGFRKGSTMINGKVINLLEHTESFDPVTEEVKGYIEDVWGGGVDREVFVVGGGSTYFYPALKKIIPHARLLEEKLDQNIYAISDGLYKHLETTS